MRARLVQPTPPPADDSNWIATTHWVQNAAVMQGGGTMQGTLFVPSLVVGNPTGGDMGVGAVNLQHFYVNGQAEQYISVIVTSANAIPVTSGVTINLGSRSLPAGKWNLSGEVWFSVASGTPNIQRIAAAISNQSATIPTDPTDVTAVNLQEPQQPRTGSGTGAVLPVWLLLELATATTYYLCAQVSWTGTGTLSVFGKIAARVLPY
jgi:hypothetical protein